MMMAAGIIKNWIGGARARRTMHSSSTQKLTILIFALQLLTRSSYRVAIYIKRFQIKRGKKFDQKKSPKIGEKRQATTFCKGKVSGKGLVGPTDMTFRWKSPRMTSPIWWRPKNRQKIAGKSRNRKTPFLPDVMMKCLIQGISTGKCGLIHS